MIDLRGAASKLRPGDSLTFHCRSPFASLGAAVHTRKRMARGNKGVLLSASARASAKSETRAV